MTDHASTTGAVTLAGLRRVRWTVRATLTFGVAASVAANILHAQPNPIARTIAAWPPLALLLTVELVSRVPVQRRLLGVVRIGATVVISAIAAWVSYWHLTGVASRYGEAGTAAYLLPISVDGLIVVASICLVEIAARLRTVTPKTAAELSTVGSAGTGVPPPAHSQHQDRDRPGQAAEQPPKPTGATSPRTGIGEPTR